MDAGGGGHAGRPGTGIGEESGPCGFGPPCDPQNLAGLSCEYFLRPGGTLGCDPSTCRFDLTGCAALPPGPGAVLEDAGR